MIDKMKKFRLLNTMGIAAFTLLMAASCENGNKEFGYDGARTVYFSYPGYERTVELGEDQEADLTDDNNHVFTIKATYGGGYNNGSDITVNYVIDPSLCEGYHYDVMPSEYYTVENPNQFTIAKGNLTGGVRVKLADSFFDDEKSYTSGYLIPVKLVSAQGVDQILESQSTTFCLVKYINPWTATYLRKGQDVINGQIVRRSYPYIENAEVIKVVTKGLNKSQVTVAIKDTKGVAHNVNLLLTFNGDDCTVSSNTQGAEVSGSGKFVKADQLMGEYKRNALYLNYTLKTTELGTVQTTDTLVVRNRGVQKVTFTPEK